jgi:hypothetical protein
VGFRLISGPGSVSVILRSELVPVCSRFITCSCSLKITFGYVPGFVSTFSGSRSISESFSALTLSRACVLTIKFGCVPDFVFTFARSRSSSPESLFALALPGAFGLVE